MEVVDVLNLILAVCIILGGFATALMILGSIQWREQSGIGLIQVVVLGDAGRSPRMQYHCLSLVQLNYSVDLVGYGGSALIKELRESDKLNHRELMEFPQILNILPRPLLYLLKIIFQTFNLFWVTFMYTKKPSHILVQTPPSIPTLFVVILSTILRGNKLIVDYHNYGHTLLALTHGPNHPIVNIAKEYEKMFSGFAYANLCVSEAMKKDLRTSHKINAIILYDRPSNRFQPSPLATRHKLFQNLAETNPIFGPGNQFLIESGGSATAFTEQSANGAISLRKKRPFLLVSSTSWTDEDFGILLEALEMYEERAIRDKIREFPKIVCVITGKGPQKKYYEKLIASKDFTQVAICTLWLSTEDYPVLLGSADLGVCLHKSSSGLDLPMKVVDMFGSGLPVCAIEFRCLHELLRHDHNGLIFRNPPELASQLQFLAAGFPHRKTQLTTYRDNLSSFQSLRWHHYWKLHVLPLISPPN